MGKTALTHGMQIYKEQKESKKVDAAGGDGARADGDSDSDDSEPKKDDPQ